MLRLCRNLQRIPVRFSANAPVSPSPYILAEELNGELIEAKIENIFPKDPTFNVKIKTDLGRDGWFIGTAHQILHKNKIGKVGYLKMKPRAPWFGYVNVGEAPTGYRFDINELPHEIRAEYFDQAEQIENDDEKRAHRMAFRGKTVLFDVIGDRRFQKAIITQMLPDGYGDPNDEDIDEKF